MDKDEAIRALESTVVEMRLVGARYFGTRSTADDLAILQRFYAVEKVRWVKSALARGIAHAKNGIAPQPEFNAPKENADAAGIRAKAVEEVSKTILHEFTPILGGLRIHAKRELGDLFEESATKKSLELFTSLVQSVRDLKSAATTPMYEEVDLHDIVEKAILSLNENNRKYVSLANPVPFVVISDPNHLQLVILNGLRNAIEAVLELEGDTSPNVIINWGTTGPEHWLVIIDNGPGFVDNPSSLINLGSSTKKDEGHFGFGLAVVAQAMQVIEGELNLSNNTSSAGARFEIRWLRHENFIR